MRVWVNGSQLEVFSGARVRDAVLKFSHKLFKDLMANRLQVTDQHSHYTDPEGELTAGQQLFTARAHPGDFT